MGRDHECLDTPDGLSAKDRENGYHWYGTHKVMHVCGQCGKRRTHFGYDYGWRNTLICTFCEMKNIADEWGVSYSASTTEKELTAKLSQTLQK